MKSRKTIEQDLQEILVAHKIRLYCFLYTIGKITLEEAVRVIIFEISKVREETIREVESKISKIPKIEMTFSDIKDVLNKLKKYETIRNI